MADVSVIIKAKDEASDELKNIEKNLGGVEKATDSLNQSNDDLGKTSTKTNEGMKLGFLKVAAALEIAKFAFEAGKKAVEFMSKNSEEFAETMKKIQDVSGRVANVMTKTLGTAINEAANNIVKFMTSAKGIETISKTVATIGASFAVFGQIVSALGDSFQKSLKPIGDSVSKLMEAVGITKESTVVFDVLKGVTVGLGVAFNVFAGIINAGIKNLTNLVEVAKTSGELLGNIFSQKWDKVGESAGKTWENMKKLATGIVDNTKSIIDDAIKEGQRLADDSRIQTKNLEAVYKTAYENIKNITEDALTAPTKLSEKELEELKKKAQKRAEMAAETAKKEYEARKKYIEQSQKDYITMFQAIEETSNATAQAMTDDVSGWGKAVGGISKSVFSGIASSMKGFSDAQGKDLSDIERKWGSSFAKVTDAINKVSGIASGVAQTISGVISSVFSILSGETKKQLDNIEKDYKSTIDSIDAETQRQLGIIENGGKTELELAQAKLDELQAMRDIEAEAVDEQRLMQLEKYKESLTAGTDAEIEAAIKAKELELKRQKEAQQRDAQEKIDLQKKEVEKQKVLADSEKKKADAEAEYRKKRAEAEKKAFEDQKAMSIATVWINAALGSLMAFANAMQLGPIAGPIVGSILATAVLTMAGVQTGIIASQQYTPSFAVGGIMTSTGVAMVGERGREAVVLPKGAEVIDASTTQNLSEGDIIINVHLDTEMIDQKIVSRRKIARVR